MTGEELQEFREEIVAGKNQVWSQAVDILRLGRTRKGLTVREAFLILTFRHGRGWGLLAGPTVTKDDALKAIAESYQEDRSSATNVHPARTTVPLRELVRLPVGLAFVGPSHNGWADEFALVDEDSLDGLPGRTRQEELEFLNDFVFESAQSRIEKLKAK
ncbi:MAG: hypothetical protein ABSA57_20580 [Candidatus Acidiferrales bacterium]|jgi:hypothetical protein